ncbi:glycosyltransferase [Marinisporobacter balticus]|uniref:Glycosyltransferase involved in cell wall biosynthesis n=1 Tax=Marinisporobacter balticus TaxID=2018667 RepID=A0A4R2LHM6_9FIRM|nr:glycosyltransferase [Marinisporobacter balticus]TCO78825.1 glycosyltransferase involved in cell wall biosynthesis [Marinisporobacter balticus]
MKKIIHIITGLGCGGAESMLYKLLKYSDKGQYYHEVITLMDQGMMGEKIKMAGIKIHSLNLNRKNLCASLIKARIICKECDIVNTWLYHADIFGFIVSKVLLKKKLIWNIRHSNLDKEANKSKTLKIVKFNSLVSRFVDCITYNSNKAFENHMKAGYVDKNSIIIPNGFELDKFKFNLDDRLRIRKELRLNKEEKVIITVGRWDIQKDYYTLLKALDKLKKQKVKFKMLMVGTNLEYSNDELVILINDYNLKDNILLLGRQNDIPALLSAADIYVSSSLGESFSNAIGEAMACELPCVVTEAGDSKIIVGNTGKVASTKNYLELNEAIISLLNNEEIDKLKILARQRVEKKYSIRAIVKSFDNLYLTVSN